MIGVATPCGAFVNTHTDALCHIFTGENGELRNGRPSSLLTEDGARTNSVDHWRDGIVTRGVLCDIPRMRGAGYVAVGHPVEAWALDDWAKAQGIESRAGDGVLTVSPKPRAGTERAS